MLVLLLSAVDLYTERERWLPIQMTYLRTNWVYSLLPFLFFVIFFIRVFNVFCNSLVFWYAVIRDAYVRYPTSPVNPGTHSFAGTFAAAT